MKKIILNLTLLLATIVASAETDLLSDSKVYYTTNESIPFDKVHLRGEIATRIWNKLDVSYEDSHLLPSSKKYKYANGIRCQQSENDTICTIQVSSDGIRIE